MHGLEDVMVEVGSARGLPNAHYIDRSVYEVERQKVLFNNWSGVGFAKDLTQPGSAKPIDFLGVPLLLLRDREGQVRVFQNTCRHRGMILVEEETTITGAIRCPYHSWCYALNGDLKSTPHVGGPGRNTHDDIDRNELGLIEIRSYVWRDVIFVNLSGEAPEFEIYAADLIERWSDFDQPIVSGGAESSFTLDVKTNWKLAVENYCESYHLPWVHPGLNSYSRLEDHYGIERPLAYSGQGTLVYRQLRDNDERVFPDFSGMSGKWDEAAEYIAFYPNVLFGVHRDHAFAIVLEPLSHERTREHIELYYTAEGATGAEFEVLRRKNTQLWKEVFEEDVFVVEGMQRGRHGPHFDGGRFSPAMDSPTHNFHQWVAHHCRSELVS